MNRTAIVAAVGVVLTAGGCASKSSGAPSSAPSAQTSVSESPSSSPETSEATGSSSSPSQAPSTHAPVVPQACSKTEMPAGTWKEVVGSAGAGHVSSDVAFQNTSDHACTISGFPKLQLFAAGDHQLPTTVTDFPATAAPLTVAPGGWVHSELRYSPDVPGDGEPTSTQCEPNAVYVLVQLPGDSGWIKVKLDAPTPVCSKGAIDAKPFVEGQTTTL